MSTGTEVVHRGGLDLTRAPWQQWDKGMVELAKRTVLKDAASDSEVFFCLALAESLGFNPFAKEIDFIRQRGRDGQPGGVVPYVGREGLVKKATERSAYFEADTVRENDHFEVIRLADGSRTVEHSYGQEKDRGEIVGAWAMLHFTDAAIRPGFSYAPLGEYLPTFDADWKMARSPWGNQRSAMIEKCAMIAAGRQRINLAGVVIDAELDRMVQQGAIVSGEAQEVEAREFDWSSLETNDHGLIDRLAAAVERVNELAPMSWPPAKCEMVFRGLPEAELEEYARDIAEEAQRLASEAIGTQEARSEGGEGGSSSGGESPAEGLRNGHAEEEREERLTALSQRRVQLEEQIGQQPPDSEAHRALSDELDGVVGEIEALQNPDQGSLL